jgi:multisubunit Na+/H+ antiporter MnhC subunit
METLLAVVAGALIAAGVHLILARSLPRLLLGLVLFGNGAIVAVLAAGRIPGVAPALVEAGADRLAEGAANPLPQALALTAIVISFGLTAFVMVLAAAIWRSERTLDPEAPRLAEPPGLPASEMEAAARAEPEEGRR